MSNEVLTLVQKRQAIEQGLRPFLDHSILGSVLEYWENKYGNLPSFVLNRFIHEICDAYELKDYRKDMLKKVLNELSLIERQVILDVNTESLPASNQQELEKTDSSHITIAFIYFVEQVIQSVNAPDLTDFYAEVNNKLSELGFKIDLQKQAILLRDSQFFPVERYAQIITVLYEQYCVFYGPYKADHLYARMKEYIKNQYPKVDLHLLV
ncbi:hypothetical protein G9F32_00265 [Acinetobacter sp. 194]|uniref:hypothetical protein n=1 Tax=Acinetobacter shaoyimingii TaxID=2715164 RepID=UPI00140C71CC|nr:hypothetical protein [Acinetobacter shaoyimingii]NHB56470.1 hypothetical protein [Acinetobacter shaoyimingii]